jgi:L-threonylcarbamoyladenylate synthase
MEDDAQIKQILIEPVIEEGLGVAIIDRINKAAFKYESIK